MGNIPVIHTLHGLDTSMCIRNDRIAQELPIFVKTSLACIRRCLQHRDDSMGSNAGNVIVLSSALRTRGMVSKGDLTTLRVDGVA